MRTRKEMQWLLWKYIARYCLLAGGLVAYIAFFTCPYHMEQIYSYRDPRCLEALQALDQQSLVLFDIDDTLVYAPDVLANVRKADLDWRFFVRLFWRFPHLYKRSAREEVASRMLLQAPRALIEKEAAELINSLKNRHIPVLSLTNLPTGALGTIPCAEEWCYELLKSLGITFSSTRADTRFTTVRDHPRAPINETGLDLNIRNMPRYRDNYPRLYKGLICTNQTHKGLVLSAFLDHAQSAPSLIVFFDDTASALQEVGEICAHRGIPCKLFLYRGAEYLGQTFCQTRALNQLSRLIRTGVWVGDAETDATLPQEGPDTARTHTPDPVFCP
ncbi:MAG: hypothetical protein QG632_720 [Candidatus Dependentiae bacterium]|nr:hypothetical protein [Candidatus Dependentiae bacterium]